MEENKKRGALVRDRDGDVWKRGNTRWTCQAPLDGRRVTRVGRLPWFALVTQYGPLTPIEEDKPEPCLTIVEYVEHPDFTKARAEHPDVRLPHPDVPCLSCGQFVMDEEACFNAKDLCIDCCGEGH